MRRFAEAGIKFLSFLFKHVFRWADQCQEFRDKDHRIPGFSLVGLNFGHVWSETVDEDKALDSILMDWYDEVFYLGPLSKNMLNLIWFTDYLKIII